MPRRSTRLGLWFALTLALPAAFAVTWAWLVPGGVVAAARARERQTMEALLARTAERFAAMLRQEGALGGFPLQLDDERRVVAPFASVAPSAPATVGVAEQAAVVRLAAGDREAALPFFALAAERGELSPEGSLAYAEALHRGGDPAAARAWLEQAGQRHGDARCGPLPFALAALLVEARWPDEARDADAVRLRFCTLVQDVPAAAVPAVLDDLLASPVGLDEPRAAGLRASAAVVADLAGAPLPELPSRGADGAALVPQAFGHVAAVPAARVDAIRSEQFALAHTLEPAFDLVVSPGDGAADAPRREVTALGETWSALPAPGALPTSALLDGVATACLVLALATLVFGNLLLWRLTRRESQLVRLRADFVDVVSHELRTPLTALSLKSEMLACGDVPPGRRAHYLAALHHDVLRLADQVERILDFGRLQKGAPLRRERVPGRALLARGLRDGRPALRLVAQHVDVDAPRELPAIVGDVDVLGRALRNLIENAAKYAPAGSTVAVRAYAAGDELVVEVADRGPGVPAGDRRSIFEPFVRGSEAAADAPGSGLGLALVAAAAESHGGRVAVAERPGGGAVFTLHLPAEAREASA